MSRVVGVLLAGGRGARLALGRPKALALLSGATLLERARSTLARVCDEVVVVAPPAHDLPLPAGSRRVFDEGVGPLGGIAAVCAAASFDRACVLGVDFPLVRPEALAFLLDGLDTASAVVPAPGGRAQPLVAAYRRDTLVALAGAYARGERSIVRALHALAPRLLDDAAVGALPGGLNNVFDVDTPDELAEAGRRLRAAGA
jgi:molybdopterin-guanine dinucleotide biosynthesis protein A